MKYTQDLPDYHNTHTRGEVQHGSATNVEARGESLLEILTTTQVKDAFVGLVPTTPVAAAEPKSEPFTLTSNLPEPRKRPSPVKLMQEVRTGLGIEAPTRPIPTFMLSAAQEEDLKADVLRMWKQHEKCEQELAQLLYRLCAALHAPGRREQGFRRWLKDHGKSHATAYRIIGRYARREGLPLPFKPKIQKTKPKSQKSESAAQGFSTFSQLRQTSGAHQHDTERTMPVAEFIAPPESLCELKRITAQYLDRLSEPDQAIQIKELIGWLASRGTSQSYGAGESPLLEYRNQFVDGATQPPPPVDDENTQPSLQNSSDQEEPPEPEEAGGA